MGLVANDLFIGVDYLNIEGRTIKHPALISNWAIPTISKVRDTPIKLIGLDVETNHLTGELKLLGVYKENKYSYFTTNFLEIMLRFCVTCDNEETSLAYWSRLDPFILYKQFLLEIDKDKQYQSMERFSKVSGKWNTKTVSWDLPPVVEIKIGRYYFGIIQAIRSCIQFFYRKEDDEFMHTVWAYDIKGLFQGNLEEEAGKRLPYYSKIDTESHLVEWDRFETDLEYRTKVLLSNEYDSRAVKDLGLAIQEEFKIAFKYYPKTLISQGSLARSAIVAYLLDKYKHLDKETSEKEAMKDFKSIGIHSHINEWVNRYGEEVVKELLCITCEAYSGGDIESLAYGSCSEAYTVDLAQAYPAVAVGLYDLTNSIVTDGTGTPPRIKNSFCFIRGVVNVPDTCEYHPLTIKHPLFKETNVRPVGTFKASYTIDERDFLIEQGATFEEEYWVNIETSGNLSAIAPATQNMVDLRFKLKAEKNNAEYMAKSASASIYGITFEAVDTYILVNDKVEKAGYRAGELFNPIFASYITARTRILLNRACVEIRKNGGKPMLKMTDSVFWQGKETDLPSELWREKKTLGFFEKPELVKDFVCLGSGRYEYKDSDGKKLTSKRRGLNITDIHGEEGITLTQFNWKSLLEIAKSSKIKVKVRTLLSVGTVLHNNSLEVEDLGVVKEVVRDVDLVVGLTKREYNYSEVNDPVKLRSKLMFTKPLMFCFGMTGENEYVDGTLRELRSKMLNMKLVSREKKKKEANREGQKKFKSKNKDFRNYRYNALIECGYTRKEAMKYRDVGKEKFFKLIGEKNGNIND